LNLQAGTGKSDFVEYEGRITSDPEQCGGEPCIRHYRIRVKDVLEMLADGATEQDILEDFPFLEREDILACLAFAADRNGYESL
jgi:uncharacterized protein (DUF433 family)